MPPDPISLDTRLTALETDARRQRLAERGGGKPPGEPPSGIEPRVARLEASVSHLEADMREVKGDLKDLRRALETNFRLLFGALIAVALGLAGLMAKGFHWL